MLSWFTLGEEISKCLFLGAWFCNLLNAVQEANTFDCIHQRVNILYLFEYKSHVCISRTPIFDMKNWTKFF